MFCSLKSVSLQKFETPWNTKGTQNQHLSAQLIACEQALCLGKNSEEREGKGGEGACRQTFEAAIPPLVIILPIICQ